MPVKAGSSNEDETEKTPETVKNAPPAVEPPAVAPATLPPAAAAAVGAAIAALMSAPQVAAATGTPVLCRCLATRAMKPGEQISRWGHLWTCSEDAMTLTCMIPAYDVENGVAAGRWRADGMPNADAEKLFLRRQYAELKGNEAPSHWSIAELRLSVQTVMLARGAKESPDFIKSE